jgi:hypothetical protein
MMHDARASTQKKIPKKTRKLEYNTIADANQAAKDSRLFSDIEITEKDRMRASEIGISQKHRRLQTSDLKKVAPGARIIENQSQIELPRGKLTNTQTLIETTLELQLDPNGEQNADRRFAQERRAKSSLSNRNGGI